MRLKARRSRPCGSTAKLYEVRIAPAGWRANTGCCWYAPPLRSTPIPSSRASATGTWSSPSWSVPARPLRGAGPSARRQVNLYIRFRCGGREERSRCWRTWLPAIPLTPQSRSRRAVMRYDNARRGHRLATFFQIHPFSVGILLMTALVVVPLSAALLWFRLASVDLLEQRSVDHRMSTLEAAVSNFLSGGLRPSSRSRDDARRAAELPGVGRPGGRQRTPPPASSSCSTAIPPSRRASSATTTAFFFAGRLSLLSVAQREEFDARRRGRHRADRRRRGRGRGRRPGGSFCRGGSTPPRMHPTSFDPRQRPWYIDATNRRRPPDRALPFRLGGGCRHLGWRAVPRRRPGLRFLARHARRADHPVQDHTQCHRHGLARKP